MLLQVVISPPLE